MKRRIKHFFTDLIINLKEVLTAIVGVSVFIVIAVLGFVWTFVKHFFIKWDYSAKKHFKPLVRVITLTSDCAANGCGGEMLNDLSKAKDGEIKYGNWYQTISSVTGLRWIFNNRTSALRRFLNKYLEKDHCELAPTEMELFYYKNKDLDCKLK